MRTAHPVRPLPRLSRRRATSQRLLRFQPPRDQFQPPGRPSFNRPAVEGEQPGDSAPRPQSPQGDFATVAAVSTARQAQLQPPGSRGRATRRFGSHASVAAGRLRNGCCGFNRPAISFNRPAGPASTARQARESNPAIRPPRLSRRRATSQRLLRFQPPGRPSFNASTARQARESNPAIRLPRLSRRRATSQRLLRFQPPGRPSFNRPAGPASTARRSRENNPAIRPPRLSRRRATSQRLLRFQPPRRSDSTARQVAPHSMPAAVSSTRATTTRSPGCAARSVTWVVPAVSFSRNTCAAPSCGHSSRALPGAR